MKTPVEKNHASYSKIYDRQYLDTTNPVITKSIYPVPWLYVTWISVSP